MEIEQAIASVRGNDSAKDDNRVISICSGNARQIQAKRLTQCYISVTLCFMNKDLLKAFKQSKQSQRWLGRETGVSNATISRWISGKQGLTLEHAEYIANALGLSMKLEPGEFE